MTDSGARFLQVKLVSENGSCRFSRPIFYPAEVDNVQQDCAPRIGPKHFVEGLPNDVTVVDWFPFLVTSEASLRELNKLLPQPVGAVGERTAKGAG